jgi:hypothetical protein
MAGAKRDPWTLAAWALLGAGAAVALATFRDPGLAWDEQVQAAYGEAILRWFGSRFRDDAALHLLDTSGYGGLFEARTASWASASKSPP